MSISKIRTSDGAEHGIDYEGLENKPAVLGEPIHVKRQTILTTTEINNTITPELDFSSYLPDDECAYKVSIQNYGQSKATANSFICCNIKTSLHGDIPFGWGRVIDGGKLIGEVNSSGEIIVGVDRKAWINPHFSGNYRGTISISANWYQKINVIVD